MMTSSQWMMGQVILEKNGFWSYSGSQINVEKQFNTHQFKF
jgi:hypothetical protein